MTLLLKFLFVLCAWASQCNQPPLKQEAQAQFRFWGFHVYNIEYQYDNVYPAPPYRLTLNYQRDVTGKKIVDSTEKEIRGLGVDGGKLSGWMKQLQKIIPNVKSGDSLVGIVDDKKRSLFCFGNQFLGQIDDPEFADYFFGIWLSDKTSQPGLRKRLLESAKGK